MCRVTRANTIRVQDETIREFFRDKYVYIQGVHELLCHCNKRAVLLATVVTTPPSIKILNNFCNVLQLINNVMQFQEQSSFASTLIALILIYSITKYHSQGV